MLATTHKLTEQEAHDIKRALLDATACGAFSLKRIVSPKEVAEGLIGAFRLVDEATEQAAS